MGYEDDDTNVDRVRANTPRGDHAQAAGGADEGVGPRRRQATAQVNHRLRAIATDGAFTLQQARSAGLAVRSVQRRVTSGQLVRLSPATYCLAGTEETLRTRQRAALLASGARALGLWSAGHEHGCIKKRPRLVHVAIDARRSRATPLPWMQAHRVRPLEDDEIVELWDMPVCTMARVVRDLASVLACADWAERQLRRLVEEALVLGKLDVDQLVVMGDRERRSPAARRLHDIVAYESGRDTAQLKSRGEIWLRELILRRGWPMPAFNVPVPGAHADGDAYWEKERVVVEFDGFSVHRHRGKHDRDRRRDRLVRRHGIVTIRVTATDFMHYLDEVEEDIARALGYGS